MNRKHQEVQVWLETLFGERSVPAYELNEFTVGALYDLMCKNVQEEKDQQLLIEDLRQKAEEYNAEGNRLETILKYMNLTSGSLSQSGVMSLRTLANLALTLRIKDATDTSFILAFQQLESEIRKVDEARRADKKVFNDLVEKTRTAVLKHSALTKALEDLDAKSLTEHPQIEKNARETQFIRTKAREYNSQVKKLETHLQKLGVDPTLYHSSLVKKAEDLDEIKKEIIPMKKRLDSYHGVPPDAIQAHMQLDELREKVTKLEEVLSSKINTMLV